jgi:DNA polymerase-3 subunit alpha
MQKYLRQLKPTCIEDLIAMNALYRPGPMDNIPQYIDGKNDPATIHYPHSALEPILKETYGVIVYQEQVMQAAQILAGYSLGGADLLRRAMGKKKKEEMAKQRVIFVKGCAEKHQIPSDEANRLFDLLDKFAGYGFNKSHAAAYAVVAYQTAYLKAEFPVEFNAAILTNQISSNDDKLAEYIEEARMSGIEVAAPDVNSSLVVFGVEAPTSGRVTPRILFGLQGIKGLGEYAAQEVVKQRATGPYKSFMDFLSRVDLKTVNKKALEVLIKTGCFDALGQSRATLVANMDKAVAFAEKEKGDRARGQASLFGDVAVGEGISMQFTPAPEWTVSQKLEAERELVGCYLSGHPLDRYRERISRCCTLTTGKAGRIVTQKPARPSQGDNQGWRDYRAALENQRRYTIIGIVKNLRVMTTHKDNKQMAAAVLDDFEGSIDIVFFPAVWETMSEVIKNDTVAAFLCLPDAKDGKVQLQVEKLLDIEQLPDKVRREAHIHIDAQRAENEAALVPIREYLDGHKGVCSVFVHLDVGGVEAVVKADASVRVEGTDTVLTALGDFAAVERAWWE